MPYIIVNLTERGDGQFWSSLPKAAKNTEEAVLDYLCALDEGIHLHHAEKGGRFLVAWQLVNDSVAPAVNPCTARVYEVEPVVQPAWIVKAA